MYDIRQFKPALYILLMLGVSGFALAAESPGLWLLAAGGISINAWLVKTHRFVPLPRLVASVVTLAALALVALEVRAGDTTPILTVGQYIILLHLIKLFEQRANRDYAQLLVLSLLLMVAAAISTASLLFGICFITYLFLSLYCCLLFHLKVEADQAKADYGQSDEKINPATLRQDQRYLSRSMRRLTALLSSVSVAMAVLVFLFFPRGPGEGMFSPVQLRSSQALTGFSDQVSFQKIAQITKNNDVAARVELYYGDQRVVSGQTLLLRGSVLDVYTGNDSTRGPWQWRRSTPVGEGEPAYAGSVHRISDPISNQRIYKQVITLQPTGTNKLFAMAGLLSVKLERDLNIRYSSRDGVLETLEPMAQQLQYTANSTGELPVPTDGGGDSWKYSQIDPEIRKYALQPQVGGVDSAGAPLAQHPLDGDHSFDGQIAANIERHLREQFRYTLDLTNERMWANKDPIVAFLYDFKAGHCEFFAGAMTLMCQSLGIPARFIVGFRCEAEDFNTLGDYYVVKQSDAHAWCEVFTGQKWETFDPTSDRERANHANEGYFVGIRKIFDFLEYKWANSVVAYDRNQRKNLVDNLDIQLTRTAFPSGPSLFGWQQKLQSQWEKWQSVQMSVTTTILGAVISLMMLGMAGAILWYLIERWRMRRRARRIGLAALPTPDQLRLVRQLGFYDDLLRILEKHHIARPSHLTPLEFSQTLSFLPSGAYDDIYRLTKLFYRIRYGAVILNPQRQRQLITVVHQLGQALESGDRTGYAS